MKCPNCGQETDDIICPCGYQFPQGAPPASKQSWLSKALSESKKKTEQEKLAYQKWQQEQRALKSGRSQLTAQELTPEQLDLQIKAAQLKMQSEQLELQRKQLETQQAQMQGMMRCPKCGSTSLSGNKKGFGIGKAVVGAAAASVLTMGLATPLGLTAGNIGAKKVRVTCLRCGHKFWAGKG